MNKNAWTFLICKKKSFEFYDYQLGDIEKCACPRCMLVQVLGYIFAFLGFVMYIAVLSFILIGTYVSSKG